MLPSDVGVHNTLFTQLLWISEVTTISYNTGIQLLLKLFS